MIFLPDFRTCVWETLPGIILFPETETLPDRKKKKNVFQTGKNMMASCHWKGSKYDRQINTGGSGDQLQFFKSLERENEAVSDIK